MWGGGGMCVCVRERERERESSGRLINFGILLVNCALYCITGRRTNKQRRQTTAATSARSHACITITTQFLFFVHNMLCYFYFSCQFKMFSSAQES